MSDNRYFDPQGVLPTMTGKYLDDTFSLCQAITEEAGDLRVLGRAFMRVGNETMCKDLSCMAKRLDWISEQVRKAVGDEVSRMLHETQVNSGVMMKGILALAGVDLDKPPPAPGEVQTWRAEPSTIEVIDHLEACGCKSDKGRLEITKPA